MCLIYRHLHLSTTVVRIKTINLDWIQIIIKSGRLFWVTLLSTLVMYYMGNRGNAKKNPLNQQSLKRDCWLNKSGSAFCYVIRVLKQRRGLSGILIPCLLELLLPVLISENNTRLISTLWAWKIKSGTKIICSIRLEEYDTRAWRKQDTLQWRQWH